MKNGIVLFVWIVFTTVIAFTTVACSKSNKNVSISETEISSEETSTTLLLESSERESETESLASETISQKEETKTITSTETTTSNSIEGTTVPETPAPTKAKEENISHKQTQATEPETKTQKVTEESKKQKETTTSYWAMQEDAPEIAKKVIKYLNDYRVKEGTFKLVQGTKEMQAFADLRSQQLVKNFAHDDDDTLAAVKKLNYGEFWSDGWVQAFSESTEAIYMSYTSGEIDEVAKSIVDGFHGSKRHWAYLGNVDHEYEELKYVAVGLTYNKGFWYCAIWMDSEQHTGPVYFD